MRFVWLMLLGGISGLVACGSPSKPTPASPPSTSTASVTSVTVAFQSTRANSALIIGESVPLAVTANFSDGTTEDCTRASQWTSGNSQIVAVSPTGTVQAIASGTASISATCRGTSGTLALSVQPGLRITGLETRPFVLLGDQHLVLRAEAIDSADVITRACDKPAWKVSDTSVLQLAPDGSGMRVLPYQEGEVTVTTTCGPNAAITPIRVGHFSVVGTVRASTGEPLEGIDVYGGISDGAGNYVAANISASPAVTRIARPGFQTLLISQPWNRQPTMRVDATLTRIATIFLEGQGQLCRTDRPGCGFPDENVHSFTAPRTGRMELRAYYPGDGYEEVLTYTLLCNGVDARGNNSAHLFAPGEPTTFAADSACRYELRLRNGTNEPLIAYRFTINMQ